MSAVSRWGLPRRRRHGQAIVIAGAGGFSREAAEAIAATNAMRQTWELLGFVDDDPALVGTSLGGVEVIGPISLLRTELAAAKVVICTGRPDNYFSRAQIVRRLALPDDRYARVIHPTVSLAGSTFIGHGTVILAGTVITANARIGNHVAIMPNAVITHDDVISDFATLASGVKLGGSVTVGCGAYIGAGSLLREAVSVGEWSMVGMGSLVTRAIPGGERWFGTPARPRGLVMVPEDLVATSLLPDPAMCALVPETRDGWTGTTAETRA